MLPFLSLLMAMQLPGFLMNPQQAIPSMEQVKVSCISIKKTGDKFVYTYRAQGVPVRGRVAGYSFDLRINEDKKAYSSSDLSVMSFGDPNEAPSKTPFEDFKKSCHVNILPVGTNIPEGWDSVVRDDGLLLIQMGLRDNSTVGAAYTSDFELISYAPPGITFCEIWPDFIPEVKDELSEERTATLRKFENSLRGHAHVVGPVAEPAKINFVGRCQRARDFAKAALKEGWLNESEYNQMDSYFGNLKFGSTNPSWKKLTNPELEMAFQEHKRRSLQK